MNFMLIPDFLYGINKDVNKKCEKIADKLKNGSSWDEGIKCTMIDTSTLEGMIVVEEPIDSASICSHKHFFVYALFDKILEKIKTRDVKIDDLMKECVRSAWGVLSLMSGRLSLVQNIFHVNKERHKYFLSAVLKHWDAYLNAGKRFSIGINQVQEIWEISSNLKLVLAQNGIPTEVLNSPLPLGGLKELIHNYKLL
jgi:hypothetical protein